MHYSYLNRLVIILKRIGQGNDWLQKYPLELSRYNIGPSRFLSWDHSFCSTFIWLADLERSSKIGRNRTFQYYA